MEFTLVACLFLAAQDAAPGSPLEAEFERLRDDDIRVREAAERRLDVLPASDVEALRRRLAAESDPEAVARLTAILRQISLREAERLWSLGRLEESLHWLIPLPTGKEREEAVQEAKCAVARGIREMLPEWSSTDDYPQNYAMIADSIDQDFGVWGTAVLLELLERGETDVPAVELLQEMGDEILPCLARCLASGSAELKHGVSAVLYGMSFEHDRLLADDHGLAAALSAVAEDAAMDAMTQARCRYVLERLRPPPCRDEAPDPEIDREP